MTYIYNMQISSDEQEGDLLAHPEPLPFNGRGTLDDPFRPAAFDEMIQGIARLAQEKNEPKYCLFEGSNFRILPDGIVEWSHRMPPLRDNIASIIENSLCQWREQLHQS